MKTLKVTVDGRSYAVEVEALDSPEAEAASAATPPPSAASSIGEAMKMNTLVTATTSGSVSTINVGAGDMVEESQALLSID